MSNVPGYLDFIEGDDPTPTPTAGRLQAYPKTDGKWYRKGSDGIEHVLEGVDAAFVAAAITTAITTSEAGQVRDGDTAGGVLAGTYPNPSFAADMATQIELDAVAAAKQPLDSDLTTIAALTATTDNIIQSVGSAWASRTPAQLKATLALVKGDVGLGNVDNTSDATKFTNTPLTGIPTAPTAAPATSTTQLATTAFATAAGAAAAAASQPLDSDLTTIAGLTATTNNVIQSVGSAWASRTPAQLKATLALVKGDVGLGNVDNTSDATKFTNTVLTGDPTAPTAAPGDNDTSIATTAFVTAADIVVSNALTTSLAPKSRLISTTAPLQGGGDLSANRTLSIDPATGSTAGSQSAANYTSVNNWFGRAIYHVEDYGVLPANSAATNVTNLNTLLQTTAPDGAKIVFGPYVYQFNAPQTTLTKDFAFEGVYGQTTIAITADLGASTSWLTFLNTGFYTSMTNLMVVNFATQTASNYAIRAQNNANPQFINCFFTGAANWAGVLDFTGTSAGNGAVIKNLYVQNFTGKAINVASPLDTMYIEDTLILGLGNAGTIGIFCSDGGAMLLSGCQIISCDNLIQLIPADTKTVSAIFAVNCFFDQGKVTALTLNGVGTGTVARCHFVGCWFTVAATGASPNCILITSAGTGIHAGIQFQNCEIMNATPGSTGTLTGINVIKGQDITISNCQLAGWTNDVVFTPASAGTCAPLMVGNQFATWGLIPASTNNVVLNVGATTYGNINITGNNFGGSSTKLTDSSTMAAGASKTISSNSGIAQPGSQGNIFATTKPALTAAALNVVQGTSIQLPTGGLRVGSRFRFYVGSIDKTAAGVATWTIKVKFGTANSTADGEILSWTSGTNTAAADVAHGVVIDVLITAVGGGTTATASGQISYRNNLTAVTGLGSMGPAPTLATGFNSGLANPYLHIDITPGAAAVMTAGVGSAYVIS